VTPSLPYLVRFRQCIIEYTSPSNNSRRPLWNAVKYASSFPVIYLSAAQRLVMSEILAQKSEQVGEEAWRGEHTLFRLWYVWMPPLPLMYVLPQAGWVEKFQALCRLRQFDVFVLVGRDERLGL
jgi:hypothetical protein